MSRGGERGGGLVHQHRHNVQGDRAEILVRNFIALRGAAAGASRCACLLLCLALLGLPLFLGPLKFLLLFSLPRGGAFLFFQLLGLALELPLF